MLLRPLLLLGAVLVLLPAGAQSFTTSQGGIPAEHGIGVWQQGSGYRTLARLHLQDGPSYQLQLIDWDAQGNLTGKQDLPLPGTAFAQATAPAGSGQVVVGSILAPDSSRHDLLVVKLDAAGNVQWTSTPFLAGDQQAWSATTLTNGDVVVAGMAVTGADHDALIARFSSTGTLLWSTSPSLPGDQELHALIPDATGITAAGRTVHGPNGADLLLMRVDLNGDTLWTRRHGGPMADEARGLVRLSNGDLLAAGTTQSFGPMRVDSTRMRNLWMLRLNAQGDTLWTHAHGDTLIHRGTTALCLHISGDGVIAGTRGNTPDNELLLLRFTPGGNVSWERTFDHGLSERVLQLVPLGPGAGFMGTGWTSTDTGYGTLLFRRDEQGN